ncbi:MAG: DNA repair protein RecN, partial [Oscillospiraceae bacterium]|nr:DNA repair protein RecN [Oscillospiraceae bacterium]
MLKELYIENLAVIEKANIPLSEGLNVFTGETGAGKSILINGINSVLGQRVTKDIVRSGCKKAVVSALFDVDERLEKLINEYGIEVEDKEILLSREINSDGGSVARINSRTVNVAILRDIGNLLVNIHGQHDNQILLSPEKHIDILDSFGELENEISDYLNDFKELQNISRKIKQQSLDESNKSFRIEQLKEIVSEIESYNLTENEDEIVEEEFQMLKNSAALRQAIMESTAMLTGTDDEKGIDAFLLEAQGNLSVNSDLHKSFNELSERLKAVSIEVSDISQELYGILNSMDLNPQRFDYLSERREELRKVMKKYGPDLSDVFELLEKSRTELDELENGSNNLKELTQKRADLLSQVTKKARILSEMRKAVAKIFVERVTAELEFLNMPNVRIEVSQVAGKLTAKGLDTVEFLISANMGEEPKPIAKIASGGELSRIMLALKNVIAQKDDIPTLIFDEIDTGVSGRAAQKIGLKLREISRHRQVLCVTHLAQIAVMGDNHLLIEKNLVDDRTVTSVTVLEKSERKHEIARIMGGDNVTDLLLKNA